MIVIPMAGKSQRFSRAGYALPKYRLPLWGETLFYYVVKSFEEYFENEPFLFVSRRDHNASAFIENTARQLGLKNISIVEIAGDTGGQAETVLMGLDGRGLNEELYIFNIDTIRPNFRKPNLNAHVAGHLEVFEGLGDHWSFVRPGTAGSVLGTAEKKRISNLCSDGLYFFSNIGLYRSTYDIHVNNFAGNVEELYIAPMYNDIISLGENVTYNVVDKADIVFCGTPEEFEVSAALDPAALFKRVSSHGR